MRDDNPQGCPARTLSVEVGRVANPSYGAVTSQT